jgi:hypothetical protein
MFPFKDVGTLNGCNMPFGNLFFLGFIKIFHEMFSFTHGATYTTSKAYMIVILRTNIFISK